MELLVVTLAHILPDKEADGLAVIRLISEPIRNAPGLVNARFYRSRNNEAYYLLLSTWEDEESWNQAEERYNPKRLLLSGAAELLANPPEQWLMHYLWGYSRPAAEPGLASAHLATIRPEQAERTQRGWIESLKRQAIQPTLSFAFFARGMNEDHLPEHMLKSHETGDPLSLNGSIFLNLLSWASETERGEFYADPNYKAISRFLNSVGVVQVITLEPL